ncbi:MAG: transporter ATP-binding protein [Haloplasmataceae bacterium]|jgi:ABC-2 type transport system ATP-binding protein|nr:transporter ATP-binding protein [Haloplasmataceae bacterium]
MIYNKKYKYFKDRVILKMLKISNLSKSYGNKVAVTNINLEIKPGEIFGFLGPNGAGKTTTIKMIVGLLKPDNGQILINGIDNQKEILKAKQQFCFIPDNPEVFEKISGNDYIQFMCNIFKISEEVRKARLDFYLEKFSMSDSIHNYISSYSHGMKQKIVLIGSLIVEPKILILDEPMVGLDPKAQHILKEIMIDYCKRGNSVFFSTHILETAEKLCDRVAIINKGQIITYGTVNEIKGNAGKDESLENIFLELTE